MKYVDFLLFLLLLSLLLLLSVAWPLQEKNLSSSSLSLSLSLFKLHSPERAVPAWTGLAWGLLRRLRTESGVVLLNVHQNHFCVSTKPQMYTSNVVGPINYICGQVDLKFEFEKSESNSDLLQKLKVFNCQTDK